MKKSFLLFVTLVAVTFSLLAEDMHDRQMCVYRNGEIIYQTSVADIDSVIFPLASPEVVFPPAVDVPAGALSVSQANAICAALESGATSGTKFYVQGWVSEIHSRHASGVETYGNGQFYLSEQRYTDDTYSDERFMAYQVYYLNNERFEYADQIQVGDYVVIYGELTNYNGIYETVGKGQAYVYSTSNPRYAMPDTGDTLQVADLLRMTETGMMPNKDTGAEKYWVKGYIVGYYDFNAAEKYVIGAENAATTNILIADDPETTDTYSLASVKLPAGDLRDLINLVDNPQNLKQAFKVYGVVEKYCGIGGVVKIEEAYINGVKVEKRVDLTTIDYEAGELSVTDFLALDAIKNLALGSTTEEEYTVRGIVKTIQKVNLASGLAQFYITDGVNDLLCYDIYALNGEKFVHADQLKEGDIVTVQSVVTNYNGTIEPKGGKITRTTNTFVPETIGPKVVTIAEALEIAAGLAIGATTPGQYQLTGTVTNIKEASTTYGNLTFYIRDNSTVEEFYIYRVYYLDNKKYTAEDPVLEIDNQVTVIGQIRNYNGTIELVSGYISEHVK